MYDEEIEDEDFKGLGNPAAVAILSNPSIVKWVLVGVSGVAGFFILKKIAKDTVEKAKQKNVSNNFADGSKNGLAAQYAVELYASMHRLATWIPDGTDSDAMNRVATNMFKKNVPFKLVANMYNRQFSRNLLNDIQNELDADELDEFNSILNGSQLKGIGFNVITTTMSRLYDNQRRLLQVVPPNTIIRNVTQEISSPEGFKIYGFEPKGLKGMVYIKADETKKA